MSKKDGDGLPTAAKSSPGAFALSEILSQPSCWNACLSELRDNRTLSHIAEQFGGKRKWLFVGCGSSFYVALSAASTLTALTGMPARAVPASEILLFPHLTLVADDCIPVLISRSGRTSEVLKVAEALRERSIPTLGISCAPNQALERRVSSAIVLPAADEQSTVMTRSFTSMLVALQALAATLGRQEDFLEAQQALKPSAERLVDELPNRIEKFVSRHTFADYVCLGQGALYGIACESALKLTEMSVSYGQSFHTLEFRHGPKSIVSEQTLIMFLLSESGYKTELEVLEEIKVLGGVTLVVTNQADDRARRAADFLVELGADGPEWARLPLYLPSQQLMGLYTGIKKGLDPDRPRHLSRVVLLEDEPSSEASKHAAI